MRQDELLESPLTHVAKRILVQIASTPPWADICERVECLAGAAIPRFAEDGRDTWLVFDYRHVEFCMYDHEDSLLITLNNFECPAEVLLDVLHHFFETPPGG